MIEYSLGSRSYCPSNKEENDALSDISLKEEPYIS